MKYKIKNIVSLKVQLKNNIKKILISEPEKDSEIFIEKFQIIGINNEFTYKILIPDDYIGWYISEFHIKHFDVSKEFLGKKFVDILENYII